MQSTAEVRTRVDVRGTLFMASPCPLGYAPWTTGPLTVAQGAETPVKVALLPDGGPSGVFIVYEKVPSSVDHYPIMTLSESTSNIPPNIAIESSL
ncbi:hypothetical protein LIER_25565 [Lithospermum erythrorhizon]|uniref:Uncharacterized protein n=1 Tax=Lithospermum erythrorhizon TaxID=34254 RepID=A0AAV3R5H0_LITER